MKKNMVRIVAALLVAMLALTLLPVGAFAATIDVYAEGYGSKTPTLKDYLENWFPIDFSDTVSSKSGVTIKTSDYNNINNIVVDGELFDMKGFVDFEDFPDEYDPDYVIKYNSSYSVDAGEYGFACLGYAAHSHKLSYWYSDSTTHWRECLVCKHYEQFDEDFMFQNWHIDGDEDRVCDVCNAEIPYHEVRVIESEGGTITVNEEEAPHRRKIVANVEAAEGYKFKKLHFTKIRDDGSEQEITRRKNADGYWTHMPTYDLEVSAEFVKIK